MYVNLKNINDWNYKKTMTFFDVWYIIVWIIVLKYVDSIY